MIHFFRREIKKWNIVLWFVFAAMALSGVALIFRGGTTRDEIRIATINGKKVYFKTYQSSLMQINERIHTLKEYARMLGIADDILLRSLLGSSNPEQMALDNCIKEALLDEVKHAFSIKLAEDFFHKEFTKTLPQGILDERGNINMDSYQYYLQHLAITPAEYEKQKEEEFKRQLIDRFIVNSFYLPSHSAKQKFILQNQKRKFRIGVLSLDDYIGEAKKETISDKELTQFYQRHKNRYRVKERRKAAYWQILPKTYGETLTISNDAIQYFYNKNKSTQFRVGCHVLHIAMVYFYFYNHKNYS